jgi:hypothetical protein
MKSISAKLARTKPGLVPGSIAVVLASAGGLQVAAAQDQLTHPTGASFERIVASQLQERCLLIASFPDEVQHDNLHDVALADGWTGILKTFNDADTHFMALCLGNQPSRAHVWLESPVENGSFVASGPQYPPNWHIGDDNTLCMGQAGDADAGCTDLYLHGDSGLLYLSFLEPESEGSEDDDEKGGDFWIVVQEDDGTPIYDGIALALNGVAAEK